MSEWRKACVIAQISSVVPGWDVYIDGAHRRIAQHVVFEGAALDDDATNRTYWSEKPPVVARTRLLKKVLAKPEVGQQGEEGRRGDDQGRGQTRGLSKADDHAG
jgi:hypothetical protein